MHQWKRTPRKEDDRSLQLLHQHLLPPPTLPRRLAILLQLHRTYRLRIGLSSLLLPPAIPFLLWRWCSFVSSGIGIVVVVFFVGSCCCCCCGSPLLLRFTSTITTAGGGGEIVAVVVLRFGEERDAAGVVVCGCHGDEDDRRALTQQQRRV
jgi:hypothetical protein